MRCESMPSMRCGMNERTGATAGLPSSVHRSITAGQASSGTHKDWPMQMKVLMLWLILLRPVFAAEAAPFPRTCFFARVDFQSKTGTPVFLENIRRAHAAGYNG